MEPLVNDWRHCRSDTYATRSVYFTQYQTIGVHSLAENMLRARPCNSSYTLSGMYSDLPAVGKHAARVTC